MKLQLNDVNIQIRVALLVIVLVQSVRPESVGGISVNASSRILSRPPQRPGSGQYPYQPDLSMQGSGGNPSIQQHPSISDIDMQLLGAMEKLVSRMGELEGRVKTLESIVHHFTKKNDVLEKPEKKPLEPPQPQRGSCPPEYVKIDGIKGKCYHLSSATKSSSVLDWNSAASQCGRLGGRLAEMLSFSDFHRISHFLTKYTNTRNAVTTDYWTGGLNPGLIWIWSESGQQIELDKRFWNENDNSSNAPGCLKLSYSVRLNTFFFKGAPCAQSQNFICEVLDNAVARALARFEKELIQDTPEDENVPTTENPQ